jgi:hypothetical protein
VRANSKQCASHYEELRRLVTGGGAPSTGITVLLYRGMAVWMHLFEDLELVSRPYLDREQQDTRMRLERTSEEIVCVLANLVGTIWRNTYVT